MKAQPEEYYRRTFEFIERLKQLDGYDQICRAIIDELEWYGFTYVTSLELPGPAETISDMVLLNNRPQEYVEHYSENSYIFKDPIVTELQYTMDSYSWDDVISRRNLTKSEVSIIYEAADFGANNGLIIPIMSDLGMSAIFCPCGENPNLSKEARTSLEMIAMQSHQALKKALRKRDQTKPTHRALTNREREIMHWVASGKTDDEIGEILNISSTTVSSHIQNSMKKLNAFKRTFAVVQAIRFGELNI